MQPSAGRQELKRLIETYAIRTRELSETIAMLGGHVAAGRKIDESLEEVKRVSGLAEQAGLDFLAFIERLELRGSPNFSDSAETPAENSSNEQTRNGN